MTTPTDPLFASQWHFPLIGDIESIWDEYTGAGVHVAVYDDGVQYTHPDLAANYDASMHFESGGTVYDAMPIGAFDAHGTNVAGLIGSVDNNGLGGTGVAHGVTLTGVNYLDDIQFQGFTLALEALAYAANFDIMSNSWGRTPNYQASQNLAEPSSARSLMNGSYETAVENGRDGLGTVIVQAAGNDTKNANGDGLNASHYTITVAATVSTGDVASYSNFGAAILVAGPAAAVTTDLVGTDGYNAGDYNFGFNGTSAATPVVSGVVALMLEANAGLGWRDVQNILAISASQTGSDYGAAGTGNEVGSWFANGATDWNGGGMSFHYSYGFGMVDAFAAVRMAEVWDKMFGPAATSANDVQVTSSYVGAPVAIADDAVTDITVSVPLDIRIEDIYVTLDMTHTDASDLEVTLIGPNGEEIVLLQNEGGSTLMDSGFVWTFGVTTALGMMSAGTWTVRIEDQDAGDTGTISGVTLDFFGAEASTDNVYHFTQDLFDLIAVDAGRAMIEDANGGEDWLNFAAMGATDITLKLDDRTVDFAGQAQGLTIDPGAVIEHAVTGDGDDRIDGNSADNMLMGMRGADRISADAGKDTVFGGAGEDTIFGRADNDILIGGAGADDISGNSGKDTADYRESSAGVAVDLGAGTATGGDAAGDTLSSIESLSGTDHIDTLTGDGGQNTLKGRLGDDTLSGGGSNDVLLGGDGGDDLNGGDGKDIASYRSSGTGVTIDLANTTATGGDAAGDMLDSIESLRGSDHADALTGDGQANTLLGYGGQDTLNGGVGNDKLTGGADADELNGGDGKGDVASYVNSDAAVTVNLGTNVNTGGDAAGDLLSGIERVTGSDFDDSLTGDSGRNKLVGGDGEDTINGGQDHDALQGGADADVFYFATTDFGRDKILDWEDGTDMINYLNIAGVGSTVFAMFTATQDGDDAVLTLNADPKQSITFLDTNVGLIDGADFL